MYVVLVLVCTILTIALGLLIVCRDAVTHFNGMDIKLDKNLAGAFFQRTYFILTTLTTIGFGDVSPKSVRAKLAVMFIIFTVVAVILSALQNLAVFVQNKINKAKDEVKEVIEQ